MGKDLEKKYVVISGFNTNSINRGNAALSYGAVTFLKENGLIEEGDEIIRFETYTNPFKKSRALEEHVFIDGVEWTYKAIPVFRIENFLLKRGIQLPWTNFSKILKHIKCEAADYGGDGLSDIYGDASFLARMNQTFILWKFGIPLIMLPQTIGPFRKQKNYDIALKVMRYASKIYVRDDRFINTLDKENLAYERVKDLSAYMKPEPFDIDIRPDSIGLNISGLTYSNKYHGLENQFENYPALIDAIIEYFIGKGKTVYLIPHSYNFSHPDPFNDDLEVCREVYKKYQNKSVILIDKDLKSPQVKYVISKMSFFIGTRMHSNFAAIYTKVPVFGLAYSYKFKGGFDANGLDGERQTAVINNLKREDIENVINKIESFYCTIENK